MEFISFEAGHSSASESENNSEENAKSEEEFSFIDDGSNSSSGSVQQYNCGKRRRIVSSSSSAESCTKPGVGVVAKVKCVEKRWSISQQSSFEGISDEESSHQFAAKVATTVRRALGILSTRIIFCI